MPLRVGILGCGRGGAAGLSGSSTGVLGCARLGLGGQVARAGGPVAAVHSWVQPCSQGQWVGRCRICRRPVLAIGAGTLMILVRRVAQRALAWPVVTAAVRARLNAITAQATQAAF